MLNENQFWLINHDCERLVAVNSHDGHVFCLLLVLGSFCGDFI